MRMPILYHTYSIKGHEYILNYRPSKAYHHVLDDMHLTAFLLASNSLQGMHAVQIRSKQKIDSAKKA